MSSRRLYAVQALVAASLYVLLVSVAGCDSGCDPSLGCGVDCMACRCQYSGSYCATTGVFGGCGAGLDGQDCDGCHWGDWGSCDRSCGGGTQTRWYSNNQWYDTRDCNTHACPVNCAGGWGSWGSCDTSCGTGGHKHRTYHVTTRAAHGGRDCSHRDGQRDSTPCTDAEQYSSCPRCAAGQYHQNGRLDGSCVSCQAGQYMPNTNSLSTCRSCPAGQYSSRAAPTCTSCAAGQYSSGRAGNCISCSAATPYGRDRDSVMYDPADVAALYGQYWSSSSCTQCPTGRYRAAGQSTCTPCTDCEDAHPAASCDPTQAGNSERGCPTTALPTPAWTTADNPWPTPAAEFPTKLEVCIAVQSNHDITNLERRMDRWIATARDYLLQGAAANAAVVASQLCAEEAFNDLQCLAGADTSMLTQQQQLACGLASTAARAVVVKDALRPREVRGTLTYERYTRLIGEVLDDVQGLITRDTIEQNAQQIIGTIEGDRMADAQDNAECYSTQREMAEDTANAYVESIRSLEDQIQATQQALGVGEHALISSLQATLAVAQQQFEEDKEKAYNDGQKEMLMNSISVGKAVGLAVLGAAPGSAGSFLSGGTGVLGGAATLLEGNPAGLIGMVTGGMSLGQGAFSGASAVVGDDSVQGAALGLTGSVMDFFHCRKEVKQLCGAQTVGVPGVSFLQMEVQPCETAFEVGGTFLGGGASSLADHVSCDVGPECCWDGALIEDTGCMGLAQCDADQQEIREAMQELDETRAFIASLGGLAQLSGLVLDPGATVDVHSLPNLALLKSTLNSIDATTTMQIFRSAAGDDQLESLVPSLERLIELLRSKLEMLTNFYKSKLEAQSAQMRQEMLQQQAQRYRQSIEQGAEDARLKHDYLDGRVREKCYVALQYLIQQTQALEFAALEKHEPLNDLLTSLQQSRLEPEFYVSALQDYREGLESAILTLLSQSNHCGGVCSSAVDFELSQIPGNTFAVDGSLTVTIEIPEHVAFHHVSFSDVAVYLLGLPDAVSLPPVIDFGKEGTSSFLDENGELWRFTHLPTTPPFNSRYDPRTCQRTRRQVGGYQGSSLCDLNSVYMRYSPYGIWNIEVSGLPPAALRAIHTVRFVFSLSENDLLVESSDRRTFFDDRGSGGTGVCLAADLQAGTIQNVQTGTSICRSLIDGGGSVQPPPPPAPPPATPPPPPAPTSDDQQMCSDFFGFQTFLHEVTAACCNDASPCIGGIPSTCSDDCGGVLTAMQTRCHDFLGQIGMQEHVDTVAATCPTTEPCTNYFEFQTNYADRVDAACCAEPSSPCVGGLPTTCSADCGTALIPMHHACYDFLGAMGMQDTVNQALAMCGSGH